MKLIWLSSRNWGDTSEGNVPSSKTLKLPPVETSFCLAESLGYGLMLANYLADKGTGDLILLEEKT